MTVGPLVSAEWLQEHFRDPDVVVVDFRWYVLDRYGRDEYLRGHMPGALLVHCGAVTGAPSNTKRGGPPLPATWHLKDEIQKGGVGKATKVVVYDDAGGSV